MCDRITIRTATEETIHRQLFRWQARQPYVRVNAKEPAESKETKAEDPSHERAAADCVYALWRFARPRAEHWAVFSAKLVTWSAEALISKWIADALVAQLRA